jgi:hypothetical protein
MLFQKLFRLLVLGGAMLGGASAGCGGQAETSDKKSEPRDGGREADSSAANTPASDGGTDAGTSAGGVIGW